MSKLVWDATGERLFETGVSHGVLYLKDNTGKYATAVVWNGLTSVSESPDGAEPVDLWADNIKYASFRSAETFGATIEAYTYPDEFAACNGEASPATGIYIGQQTRKMFGFSFRTDIGNDTDTDLDDANGYKIHLIWGASASPSERSYETINDSPDAIQFSWEITTTPVPVTGYKPTASMVIDSTKFTGTTAAYLTALEDALYGTQNAAAYLPTPDEVISLLTTGALPTP